MQPRSLIVPPGIPEFLTRERTVESGLVRLEGRAWSGWGEIAAVEVSVDDGRTWDRAELSKDLDSPWAWRYWSYDWPAAPGRHIVSCRASDTAGNTQPLEQVWNVGGYANNAVQRIAVNVV
jgi:hypothetical protein